MLMKAMRAISDQMAPMQNNIVPDACNVVARPPIAAATAAAAYGFVRMCVCVCAAAVIVVGVGGVGVGVGVCVAAVGIHWCRRVCMLWMVYAGILRVVYAVRPRTFLCNIHYSRWTRRRQRETVHWEFHGIHGLCMRHTSRGNCRQIRQVKLISS